MRRDEPRAGQLWRHKSGALYRVLFVGGSLSDEPEHHDGSAMVVYKREGSWSDLYFSRLGRWMESCPKEGDVWRFEIEDPRGFAEWLEQVRGSQRVDLRAARHFGSMELVRRFGRIVEVSLLARKLGYMVDLLPATSPVAQQLHACEVFLIKLLNELANVGEGSPIEDGHMEVFHEAVREEERES